MPLTFDHVAGWRARRHHLDTRAPSGSLVDVASELCGLHAQLLSSAELSAWARVEGLAPGEVERALWEERSLVKQWAMRGTLHLLPTAELPLWHGALGTYDHFRKPVWHRSFISAELLDALLDAVPRVLDGRALTREELADAVVAETGSEELRAALGDGFGAVLKPVAFAGELCFAPGDGARVRFTRPRSWVEVGEPVAGDEALPAVLRRYVEVHGPCTREDVARWWAGVTPARAAKLLRAQGAEEVDVAGRTMLTFDAEGVAAAEPPRTVRLLPAFDPYVIAATKHADGLLADAHKGSVPELAARIYRPQGWLSPVLCVGGRFAGVWKHERRGRRVVVEVEPFGTLPRWARDAAADEAERLAAFLGGTLDLEWA